MGWQDILKSEEGEMQDLAQELEVLFRGFPVEREMTPEEERRLRFLMKNSPRVKTWGNAIKPYIRSMEYMQDFPEIKRDGLNFVMSFEVYDQTFTVKKPLFTSPDGARPEGIGEMSGDTFPELESGTRICIKAMGVMTNGDMMVAILLASKNDQLPAILTLPAYVERFFPQLEFHDEVTIFNDMEHSYKFHLIRKILKEVEGLPDEELPTGGTFSHIEGRDIFTQDSIDSLNRILTEYVPNKLLGGW